MDSEDDFSPDLPIPDVPLQSRTLLHYFSKTKPNQDKGNVSSQPKVNDNSSRKSKEDPEINAPQTAQITHKKEKACENSQVNTVSTPGTSSNGERKELHSKGKPTKQKRVLEISKETIDECEKLPAAKRVRSAIESLDTTSKSDNGTEVKVNKGINAFFKTVTKDEFRKECEKEAEKTKVTVTAIVHTPNIPKEHQLNQEINTASQSTASVSTVQIPEKAQRRKCSFSNVVRPNSETDTIKVISQEQILREDTIVKYHTSDHKLNKEGEITAKYNHSALTNTQAETAYEDLEKKLGISGDNDKVKLSKQNKVSDKLFGKKKRKDKIIPDSELPHGKLTNGVSKETDDSVDVDFFNMQATIPNEEAILSIDKRNIEDPASSTLNVLNTEELALSSPPASLFNTHTEQISSPKKKIPKLSCSIANIEDTIKGKSHLERNCLISSESKISSKAEKVESIPGVSTKDKRNTNKICNKYADVSSDKIPTPVSLFKHKDPPPKRKYSKRAKGSGKSNAVNGKAHVNYDSDSIDLDLLATYNAKTFHSAASGETVSNTCVLDSSNDESNTVFSALMKKPLSRKNASATTSPNTMNNKSLTTVHSEDDEKEQNLSPLSNNSDKENQDKNHAEKGNSNIPQISAMPNAFVKLMSVAKSSVSNGNTLKSAKKCDATVTTESVPDFSKSQNGMCENIIASVTPEIVTSEISLYAEPIISISVSEKEDSSNSTRRHSSRIQRNRERDEAKSIDLLNAINEEASSVDRKKKTKKLRKRSSLVTNKNREEKHGAEITDEKECFLYQSDSNASDIDINNANIPDNKAPKTASIFLFGKKCEKKSCVPKITEDAERVAARKAFLLSSVPQVLRNQVDSSKQDEVLLKCSTQLFSSIGHINQINCNDPLLISMNKIPNLPIRQAFMENNSDMNFCHADSYLESKDWLAINWKSGTKRSLNEQYISNGKETSHLNVQQIYNYMKLTKLKDQQNAFSTQQYPVSTLYNLQQNLNTKQLQSFPVKKIFRRYVERKLEADTLESEARKKNISLNEIEEERLSSTRKLRRRARGQNSGNAKYKKLGKRTLQEDINIDEIQDNQKVAYDPNSKSSMVWTIKYGPKMADDVIGNSNVVKKLQKWLGEWEARDLARKKKRQLCTNEMSDSSEFDSDVSGISELSSDEEHQLQNTALLIGPNGIGKTATVYALAHEMGLKVLELNASSTRSGRQVLANLREATQSHSVKKQEKSKGDEKSNGLPNKKECESKASSTEETKGMDKTTVILFEDIDIVFEDLDEGFHSAINNLITTTKRPIVLTTSSQNFMSCNRNKILNLKCLPQIFEFRPIQPRIIAKYLQLLCLVEGFCIDFCNLLGLVLSNKGNISACMHQLQYWVSLYGSGVQDIPYNYLKNNVIKLEATYMTDNASDKEKSSRPVEKEDSLAKLLSINQKNQNVGSAIPSLLNCSLSLIGLELDNATIQDGNNSVYDQKPSLLNESKVLNKLLAVGSFDIFDWSRHILLPFRRIVQSKGHTRSTPYPLTAKITNISSSLTSRTAQFTDIARTKESQKTYNRILNNDSLFMTESEEDNSTADESSEVNEDKILRGNTMEAADRSVPKFDKGNGETIQVNSTYEGNLNIDSLSNTMPLNVKGVENKETKRNAYENARKAIDILSEYADCISNFIPLQDDQPFWLSNNHKGSNCSSQLCANSNYYDSFMMANNFELGDSYSSNKIDKCNSHDQILAQEIIANTTHLAVKFSQNRVNELLPNETQFLELSVYSPLSSTDMVTKESLLKGKGNKSSEDLCAEHINEKMTKNTTGCDEFNEKGLFSRDLICEASMNKDFERGFDINYVKQLHNAEREVMESFIPEPTVNIRCPIIQDTLPVIRGIARIEEHRKASGLGFSKKRTSRSKFLHYFETQNLYSMRSETVLNTLCNAFQ